jgi:hypothetical protein
MYINSTYTEHWPSIWANPWVTGPAEAEHEIMKFRRVLPNSSIFRLPLKENHYLH